MKTTSSREEEVWMDMFLEGEFPVYRSSEGQVEVLEERLRLLQKAQKAALKLADENYAFIGQAVSLRRKIEVLRRELTESQMRLAARN